MPERIRYVISYDVVDDKRRTKLAECLDGYGDRVHYSVFEAVLDRALFDKMLADVRSIMNAVEDRVAIYRLCSACARVGLRLGKTNTAPGEEIVFVV